MPDRSREAVALEGVEPSHQSAVKVHAASHQLVAGAVIAGRYRVEGALGSGGMASVYRVIDTTTGREVALKRLLRSSGAEALEPALLFEREFHTLAQLSHPRVIAVYDFGVDEHGSFYTMELLDGGDLKERSPLPWREACVHMFDVCSSLALVHSRRMTHGDVSPRNVRCTREGHAKLIDFGAMAPMGRMERIVGTPAFAAPEIVSQQISTVRTDLYSVGATFYYTLTGQLPYAIYTFADLMNAGRQRPQPPSRFAADIPAALDALVLSLLEHDPELRPRTTFEVMQRIAAIAGLAQSEHIGVAQSYLSTPNLVGRDQALNVVRERLEQTRSGRGGGLRITGPSGVGLSRMLEACMTSAKLLGITVLRAPGVGGRPLSAARALLEHLATELPAMLPPLVAQLPALAGLFEDGTTHVDLESLSAPRAEVQAALATLIHQVSMRQPLVLAVDGLARVDEQSCALLAAIAHGNAQQRVLLMVTHDSSASGPETLPLRLLVDICAELPLEPLSTRQTHELLTSVFGDVPNLELLSRRVFARAQGNARLSMELLQHLVDRRLITYDRGSWTLPEELHESALPVGDSALRDRIALLSPLAHTLVAAHGLSLHDGFDRDDYRALFEDLAGWQLDAAIAELMSHQILSSDGRLYWLAHRATGQLVVGLLSEQEFRACHLGLARVCERRQRMAPLIAEHFFAAGEDERGVDILLKYLVPIEAPLRVIDETGTTADWFAQVVEVALEAAERLERPARDVADLQFWIVQASIASDPVFYKRVAPSWQKHLERDSGLAYYRQLSPDLDPGERLTRALIHASEQYKATPPAQRVYSPEEAIRLLVRYVAISIAAGTKSYDGAILVPLPSLVEPFVGLSPLIHAIWQNALATVDSTQFCRVLSARQRWMDVLSQLTALAGQDAKYVELIRSAVAFGLGLLEARVGLSSASRWVDMLDADRLQAVNAMYLRKIIRLQYGDLAGAEACRKQAELLAVQANAQQLFASTLVVELIAHAMARDVQGVKQIRDRIRSLAARYAGWRPFEHLAEAQFLRLISDLPAALAAVERGLALCAPDPNEPHRLLIAWPATVAVQVETLADLERLDEALAVGESALAQCEAFGIDVSAHPLVHSLALAEARLGHYERAAKRVQSVIDQQQSLGVTGMHLGASYEARVRIAALAHDREAFKHYARLTAEEYRHGMNSALSARYAALVLDTGAELATHTGSDFSSTVHVRRDVGQRRFARSLVERELRAAATQGERAQRALALLCDAHRASAGNLYMCGRLRLELVASQAPEQLPDNVDDLAQGLLTYEAEVDAIATQILTGAPRLVRTAPSHIQTYVLSGQTDGRDLIVGVIAIASVPGAPLLQKNVELMQAVGTYLLRAGDTVGIPRAT